jgi:hypothetical protein
VNAPGIVAGLFLLFGVAAAATADWAVRRSLQEETSIETTVAASSNPAGYRLEIYRDDRGAIRCRFSLPPGLTRLEEKSCPTFQIDRGLPANRSINDAACLSASKWAEYVLGYDENGSVVSPKLLSLMNGNSISFRFRLASGNYRETQFSLLGSKRSLTEALGGNVVVTAR